MWQKIKSISVLVWILLILIIVVYFWSATSVASETTIIQTTLAAFNPDLLNEKNPILIQDRVANTDEFIETVFKWVWVKKQTQSSSSNKNSYTLFHPPRKTTITIHRPGAQSDVDIIVPEHAILILPMRWTWSTQDLVDVWGINTLFGLIF